MERSALEILSIRFDLVDEKTLDTYQWGQHYIGSERELI